MDWHIADVSANGSSMHFPGRYIGGVFDKSAPTDGQINLKICIIRLGYPWCNVDVTDSIYLRCRISVGASKDV
jgi:hypothetical protein